MNKKYTPLILSLLLTALFVQCVTTDKIKYRYPDAFTKEQRKELKEKCDKGKELFKIHCSECHGIFTKGKDQVPNFTEQQIDNYTARFLRHDPKNHAVTRQMSPDQMNQILNFLRFRELPKSTTQPAPKTDTKN